MSNSSENQKRKAMSDVKILVCALVICVLLCVLLVVVHRRMRSRQSNTDLTGLGKAMEIYGKDYDDELPPAEDANESKPSSQE